MITELEPAGLPEDFSIDDLIYFNLHQLRQRASSNRFECTRLNLVTNEDHFTLKTCTNILLCNVTFKVNMCLKIFYNLFFLL